MYYVYILASDKNGTLYIGITNDLIRRVSEHKAKRKKKSFTAKYNVELLVYYEIFSNIYEAIKREKLLKRWKRSWKLTLIEESNPLWSDLSDNVHFNV